MKKKFSLVIPVYKNQESIPSLLKVIEHMSTELDRELEVVFVVDGSPDDSFNILRAKLDSLNFPAKLISHSRNFGSFAAVRTGLAHCTGEYSCVMAADLQEPASLFISMFKELSQGECDVVVGTRDSRTDPLFSKVFSNVYWYLYRKFVVPDMPKSGVDVFGCNSLFREQILALNESRTSLVALIYWLGFNRIEISYTRSRREFGVSSWTMKKKVEYMLDSIFSFTDLPIKVLLRLGGLGILVSICLGILVLLSRFFGLITEPGYSATVVLVMFFGALNLFGLGLAGEYAWRAYENTKQRPQSIIRIMVSNDQKN